MTKEKLLRYLRDPEYLHQISYQELKTLVAEHPNSYTLRHLLAIKSKQEGNADFTRQKEFASLYSIDRPHLFDILTRAEILEALPDGVLLQEDYLELKELSTLEKELSMTGAMSGALVTSTAAAIALPDLPIETTSKVPISKTEDKVPQEVGEYYTLDFDQEISETTSDSEEVLKQGKVTGSLAEIEAIFEDVDTIEELEQAPISTEEIVADDPIETNEVLEDAIVNEEFIDIPLDIINIAEQPSESELIEQTPELVDQVEPTSESEEQVSELEEQVSESVVHVSELVDQTPELVVDATNLEEQTPKIAEVVATKNPQPKSRFSTWKTAKPEFAGFDLIGYNSRGMIDELANKQTKKISTNTTIITQNNSSVGDPGTENLEFESDIASETLAKILIIQGHYIKAIAMYKRLSLIFPEKSGLFAAEIKKIENLEDRSA